MPAAEAYYLHSVIPSSRGCGASMSVWSAQTIASKQLGDRGPGRCAAAVTDDRRTTAVQMLALLALLALPLLNQRQRERQPRLQTSAMPWPCCCCCCCCVSLSTSSAQSTPVTNAPMPRQIPYLPCPACPLPCCFHPVQSCAFSLSGLPSPSVQCSCSAHLLPESHPISCSARRRQACAPRPSAICLPCLSVRRCLSAGPVVVALLR
jgi:hypothetical protein